MEITSSNERSIRYYEAENGYIEEGLKKDDKTERLRLFTYALHEREVKEVIQDVGASEARLSEMAYKRLVLIAKAYAMGAGLDVNDEVYPHPTGQPDESKLTWLVDERINFVNRDKPNRGEIAIKYFLDNRDKMPNPEEKVEIIKTMSDFVLMELTLLEFPTREASDPRLRMSYCRILDIAKEAKDILGRRPAVQAG